MWNFDDPDIYFVLGELYRLPDKWIQAFTLYTAFRLSGRMEDPRYLASLGMRPGHAVRMLKDLVYG
jgi:hypothetical protein